ncbi:MAG: CDP-glycerol glycerophosphotransferase family protein [Bacteroides sp.]|nr:CDP-glycerol glycerophosphotransferase family protein [Alistipes timonensis]MCM1310984.1 CDP-glycerol glycerophosphotransferase family protein [Bacteroides sp.]MCM1405151.1 CDP-glycerol glycerophosphotransferase family protein [[Clostridium] fimetarium]
MLKTIIRHIIPYSIRKRRYYINKLHGRENEEKNRRLVEEISRRNEVKVLFIASTLPMWRYQGVVDLMRKDPRFKVSIIIAPFSRFNEAESISEVAALRKFFVEKGIPDVPSTIDSNFDVRQWFVRQNHDLIFYCQQYAGNYGDYLEYDNHNDKLWGYIPYGLITLKEQFVYNTIFLNLAWRVYQASPLHLKTSKQIMRNDAINVRVVGEPNADKYLSQRGEEVWLKMDDEIIRKRIIWAPHFSISNNSPLNRASFLWLFDGMLEIARKYSDKVQFAFKPHPLLYTTLCDLDGWGKKRTDEYYKKWADMPNTQFESGDFTELFMQSDGMIHDCGSFTGEYMFTQKPVIFATRDWKGVRRIADEFGRKCLDLHYVANQLSDIEDFIQNIILSGKDSKIDKRRDFFNRYLLPPGGRSVAENVYNDIVKSLRLH